MSIRLDRKARIALAERIKADIDQYCVAAYDDGPRSHLGASEIGEECHRRLVYSFRWMHREQFSGRMLRLFQRGHLEERRFEEWLRGILAQVYMDDGNGKQIRIPMVNHFGGSLDGVLRLPERYNLQMDFLTEFKTHNEKSFNKLFKEGVKSSKPKHWQQMCVYGEAMQLPYALYFAINKNDDDIHLEVVELDWVLGRKLREEKAPSIVNAHTLPFRIAATSAYIGCKFCPMAGVCHNNEPIDVNCRSCKNSRPQPDNSWHCELWNATIPREAIPQACQSWEAFS